MAKFNTGDTVYLKSGGPTMTVRQYKKERTSATTMEDMVSCLWFDQKGEIQYGSFYEDELKKEINGPSIV